MELILNIEQLKLKSEYLHTNPRRTFYHEDSKLFVSWNNCVTVLYFLDNLDEASTWNPIEPIVSSYFNVFKLSNHFYLLTRYLPTKYEAYT